MRRFAFTLVELLIVVIILGILAAVVIPQFSDASEDARASSLTTNLQTIRGQIELYKLQHNGTYPTAANFVTQMTAGTKVDGTAGTDFGPYLQAIPNNPYTNTNDVTGTTSTDGTKAWYYTAAGVFKANDSAAHAAL